MTRRRWIADEYSSDRAALTGAHAAHLARVLRAQAGQEYDLVVGASVRRAVITRVAPERVEFSLHETIPSSAAPEIVLLLSIFKFENFEWAVEKCTELGAARIIPVIARRTDTHLAHAAVKRVERWRKIAFEASQQSRRVSPPTIDDPMKLKDALALGFATKVLLSENENNFSLRQLLEEEIALPLAFAIGSEGGWSEEEVKMFEAARWRAVTLGTTILRVETAAISAMAIANAMLI